MPCIIVSKEKIVPFGKKLFMGGAQLGGHSKKFNVFGGQEENVSSKKNSSPPPRDFINERSLKGLGHSISILSYFQVQEGCGDNLASFFYVSLSD